MSQSAEGTLLTLNVLRPRASAGSAEDGLNVSALHADASLRALEGGGLSPYDVLLQVDEQQMLRHGVLHPTPAAAAGAAVDPTVGSSPATSPSSSLRSTAAVAAPSLLGVSPLCLSSHDSSAAAAIRELLITGLNLHSPDTCVRARCQGGYLSVSCSTVEQDDTSPGAVAGQQCMLASVRGVPSCSSGGALIMVELQRGSALSAWKPIVVVSSQKAAMELNSLQSAETPFAGGEVLLADLGRWLDYVAAVGGGTSTTSALGGSSTGHGGGGGGSKGKGFERTVEPAAVAALGNGAAPGSQYYSDASEYCAALTQAAPRDRMLSTGLHLLSAAADRGWPHTCQLLLDSLLSLNVDYDWVVGMTNARGPSLLVRAVRSKSFETVQAVYRMGEAHDHSWKWNASQAHGITALHVAAVMPDDGRVARAIVRAHPAAARLWQTAKAFDGLTPADCATRCGRNELNAAVQQRLKELASPFQSQEQQEDDAKGRPQRLLAGGAIDPEEMMRVMEEAAAHARELDGTTTTTSGRHSSAASAASSTSSTATSVISRGGGGAVPVPPPSGAAAVLRCCVAGRFESSAVESRYRAYRTVQALPHDQMLYPLLVVLMAVSVTISHLKQGGGVLALFTVLLGLAGQLALVYCLTYLPAFYLRRRQEVWMASQLVRPALLVAVATNFLPLPLTWAGPSAVNALAHALLLPALEHLNVPDSAVVRALAMTAEVAAAMCGSANIVAAVAYAIAVAVCGVCVSTGMDWIGRTAFLATTKSD